MQTLVLWCQECAFISEVDWSGWVYTVLKAVQSIFYCNKTKNVQYGVDLVVVEECTWRYITQQPCKQQCNNQWRELEWWDVHSAKAIYKSAKCTRANSKVGFCGGYYTVQKLYIKVHNALQQAVKWIRVEGGQTGCCSPSTVNFNPFNPFTPLCL